MSARPESPRTVPEALVPRRAFFSKLGVLLGALTAAVVGIPVAGYMLAPFFRKNPRQWRDVGPVDGFEVGTTVEVSFDDASSVPWSGITAKTGAWLRRTGQGFIAYSINCTHLGCPIRWVQKANLFMCPCHGGVYYEDGRVAAGPPPKPLSRYPVRIRGGRVEIQSTPIPIT